MQNRTSETRQLNFYGTFKESSGLKEYEGWQSERDTQKFQKVRERREECNRNVEKDG